MAAALNLTPLAKQIFDILRMTPTGMTTIGMERALKRGRGDEDVKMAVAELKRKGLIRRKTRGEHNLIIWTAYRCL